MKKLFVLLSILFIQLCLGQSPDNSDSINNFIPKNWKLLLSRSGDLNKDKYQDMAIIIEEQNANKYKLNETLGPNKLNLNPRQLLILFGDKNGVFKLIEKNNFGFIPSENSEEIPCLEDPLLESDGIEIKKGILIIHFNYWLSCGSWYATDIQYSFRYQNNEFELIGFDTSSHHRSTGDDEKVSINFSTKKKVTTTGGNIFNEENNHPESNKKQIKINSLLKLSDCNNQTYEKLQNL